MVSVLLAYRLIKVENKNTLPELLRKELYIGGENVFGCFTTS